MRIFTCQLLTETNTFSPVPTGLHAYQEMGIHHGDASLTDPDGVFAILRQWLQLAEAEGHEVIEGLAAQAQPGGRTLGAVYEEFRDEILQKIKIALPLDAILLNLHGAMSADGYDDCEGDLLYRIREIVGPGVAIGIEIDLHCHLTSRMLSSSDIIISYKEYPHTDIYERAEETYRLTVAAAKGAVKPVISTVDCHMVGLWHTTREPMAGFVQKMKDLADGKNILSISFGHGFPWGDITESGARLWVITNDRKELGDHVALDLANELFALREETRQPLLSIDQALDKANEARIFPIVAADGADNPGGGAPSDSTFILERVLERGVSNVLIAFIYDPEVVKIAADAGVGASLDLRIGGKTGVTSGNPVDLKVEIKAIIDNHFQAGLGLRWPLGKTVWLRAAHHLDLVITSIRSQPFDPECLEKLGIDLIKKRLIVLKSVQHFYALFAPIAHGGVLYIAAPGALTPDFAAIPYKVRPLDYWPRQEDVRPEIIAPQSTS